MRVEFYPSLDDLVYVADSLNSSVNSRNTFVTNLYYAYLAINTILVPVVLWAANWFVPGLVVFAFNLVVMLFLIPGVNRSSYKKYYQMFYAGFEDESAVVEIDDDGVRYELKGNVSYVPWKNITGIEETDSSIYFWYEYNAISIRKTGFAYKELEREFLTFARDHTGKAATLQSVPPSRGDSEL